MIFALAAVMASMAVPMVWSRRGAAQNDMAAALPASQF
jgi:hypothetical protein